MHVATNRSRTLLRECGDLRGSRPPFRRMMNPYANPKETKVGANRPKIQHVAETGTERRTKSERQAQKESVAAERRRIKKSARQHLRRQMLTDLNETV